MYKIPANTLFTGQKLIYVPECHSTNSLLSEFNDKSELPEGTTVITSHQTAGRGQRGNRWESAPGQNLTFSILLKPRKLLAKDQFQLNMAISLAVSKALQEGLALPVRLKWPNDIFVGEKKIGGILIENQLRGNYLFSSVIGIGVNVNQSDFAFSGASSLANFSGHPWDLNETFQRLLEYIELEYLDLLNDHISTLKTRYLSSLYKFNESHQFKSSEGAFMGTISDVDEDGRLCVTCNGKTNKFFFKEIQFITG